MKKLLIAFVSVIFALSSMADGIVDGTSILVWMVEDIDESITKYDSATLFASPDGTVRTSLGSLDADEFEFAADSNPLTTTTLGDYSYWVELYSAGNLVGLSEIKSYAQIQNYFTHYVEGSTIPGGTWGVEINAVPEPTSGMLLLFGLAGLALRRRQKV